MYAPVQQAFEFFQRLPQRDQMVHPKIDVSVCNPVEHAGLTAAYDSAPGEFLGITTTDASFESFDRVVQISQLLLELSWIRVRVTRPGLHSGE